MTVDVVDSGEEDVRLFPFSADDIGVEGGGEAADLAVGNVSRSTLLTLSSSRLFRLTGVEDLDGVCPSLPCSLLSRSLLLRLLLRSVAGVAADDDDAIDLVDLFFFVLLFVEDPGLVVRVILSFFFFMLLFFEPRSLLDLSSLLADEAAAVVGRGGRLMVTMRAPVLLDRRDDVFDTTLATSEGVQCVDERHMSASSLLLLVALAEVAEADDRPPPRRKKGIAEGATAESRKSVFRSRQMKALGTH